MPTSPRSSTRCPTSGAAPRVTRCAPSWSGSPANRPSCGVRRWWASAPAPTNTSGTYDWFVVGFSPRKTALTIYGVYDGYGPADPLFDELGPHTVGKGCLYLKRLDAVDASVLERLIRQAWEA